jgi:hypothetical protein
MILDSPLPVNGPLCIAQRSSNFGLLSRVFKRIDRSHLSPFHLLPPLPPCIMEQPTMDPVAPSSAQPAVHFAPRSKEPRWPAMVALLAVGGLRLALPERLSVGPNWLLLTIVVVLMVPTIWSRYADNHSLNRILGHLLTGIVTLDMVWSLYLLIRALPVHSESPRDLLRSAGALWLTNILVFASWYWRLDAGGPHARELRGAQTDGAFLFPQMTLDAAARREMGEACWTPGFIDYLFLAFNTSTAFSPTDSPVLSRWAKSLMMIQSLISFATVVLLAARAVNIL